MTKRKYSTAQKLYMTAKANLQLAEEKHNAAEAAYIKAEGITNPDGTTPERIYMIDDENTFETVSAEFDETAESKTTCEELLKAKKIFKDAETSLLDYALNVVPVPAKEREILTRSAETNYTTRKKIIDLVMNLDASTVPAI